LNSGLRCDVVGCGARCIGRGSTVISVDAIGGVLGVDLLLIHKLGGSGKADFAKGSVKERGKATGGLVGLTAAAVETVGSVGSGGCVIKRVFTGLRGAVSGSSSGARGGMSLRGSGAVVGRSRGLVLGES
jgi:hypothetical protein